MHTMIRISVATFKLRLKSEIHLESKIKSKFAPEV